jgi:hypothetical protein
MAGYSRDQFGSAWEDVDQNGCDTRDDILRRDLRRVVSRAGTNGCVVVSGVLADPYTATSITYVRGRSRVDIDHVVSLGDAWRTGAARWAASKRLALGNDPLNLLAVSASANRQKGDDDAAAWLPANKAYRCVYVARQLAVKLKYALWATSAYSSTARRCASPRPAAVRSISPPRAIRRRHPRRRRPAPRRSTRRPASRRRATPLRRLPLRRRHQRGSATRTRVSRASPVATEPSFSATTACGVSRAASRGRAPATAA